MTNTMDATFSLDTIKDYDDEDACEDESSEEVNTTTGQENSSSRDEEAEIRKQNTKETKRVQTWRANMALALLATAVAVTATTYYLLVQDEDEAFHTVFDQFARSLADSAIRQQRDIRLAFKGLSDHISLNAEVAGDGVAQWPFYWPPAFEHTARDFLTASTCEWIGVNNVVPHSQREDFVNFTTAHYQDAYKLSHMIRYGNLDKLDDDTSKYQGIVTTYGGVVNGTAMFVEDEPRDWYLIRTMQSAPPRDYSRSPNWNMRTPWVEGHWGVLKDFPNEITLGNATAHGFQTVSEEEHRGFHTDDSAQHPHSYAMYPIHRTVGDPTSEMVAWMIASFAWDAPLRNLLPTNVNGLMATISNNCGATFSYVINGKEAHYQGYVDAHEDKYDDMSVFVDLALNAPAAMYEREETCMYSMKIYPTQEFEDTYKTNTPLIFAIVVAITFVIVGIVFVMYDRMVLKRNEKMIANAAKSNKIVSSFIPDHLRDRLLDRSKEEITSKKDGNLKAFLNTEANGTANGGAERNRSAPLADLFLDTTVCFADVVGFTAWSSARDPSQVFTLLETLYQAFDRIAKKRRVFKVETVGDCYVAVCGMPDPRKDHSVAMARFARDILSAMNVLTNELVVTLGPDTGDLMLRIGLHSGAVTAGVLRGERARFQLFGDTMNTCARMESSSKPNRIQCSKETADHLVKMGKSSWIQKRPEPILLKGKGEREGFWVVVRGDRAGSVVSGRSANSQGDSSSGGVPKGAHVYTTAFKFEAEREDRTERLIDWNCEVLTKLLKEVVARQMLTSGTISKSGKVDEALLVSGMGESPLEEVREIVTLPHFDSNLVNQEIKSDEIELPEMAKKQLREYIAIIASMYRPNSFHCFEHASHVMMSVNKLMSRIQPPDSLEEKAAHDHTFGINADPLTRFACAFSALIHDVDHTGVSNAQLVKDENPLAIKYVRSVAEQNSLDLSWDLLMQPDFKDLRAQMFQTQSDLVRFRQLVVNAVMSTDIVDKDLKKLRNDRWDKAFKMDASDSTTGNNDTEKERVDRKATIVIEHIIQASDISHTMQHWIVYRKWNQKLFDELYVAYLNGKMEKDPATFWYKGELGFFDFYIIPLTKKLKECGVFGISSEEYLQYALSNRKEWEARGEECVTGLAEDARKKYGIKDTPQEVVEV